MIHNGIKCRKSNTYGWRYGNPETDVDRHGDPVHKFYPVIVRIKDCTIIRSNKSV